MDLIRRSQAGDRGAFSDLFHKYKNLVYKTAYLMLDNAEDAEDVLQEVFIRVHKSLSTFQPSKGAFTTWLFRITLNHCLNRRRKRRLLVLSLDEVSAALLADPTASLENQSAEEEATQQALGKLSEKLRTVIVLRYYWELSYAEIAQVLDIPVGTVKSRLSLALKTLQEQLETTAEDSPTARVLHRRRIAE